MVFVRRVNQISCEILNRLCIVLMHCIYSFFAIKYLIIYKYVWKLQEMALFFTQYVILAIGHLKKPMNLLFEFSLYVLAHCHLMCISPVVDSEFWCLSSCIKYIYFYVSDFGERGQFAYLHILSFVFLACFCKFNLHFFMQTEGKILLLP